MKTYIVKTFDGIEFNDSALKFSNTETNVKIEFEYKGGIIKVEDDFPFMALVKIRMELEELGIKILCNGSRLDVYPSGMGMMSLKGYELKMGEHATKLLNIFEPTEDLNKIATVKEQKMYYDNWFRSIK